MGAAASAHPTDQVLRLFAVGKLDEARAGSVRRHLASCSACRARVAEIGGSPTESGPALAVSAPAADNLPAGLADHPDYQVIRELGRGGMGVVYLAHNRLMERDEVLKIVSGRLIERTEVRDRFLREIQSAARLQHRNVVTAYSARRLGESIALAMEYVEGIDLSKLVKSAGPLPIANACNYIHQAALGLQHAHERGMVHRDIKPANLILARNGQKAIVKVLDFGLAKVTSEDQADSSLTREGQMLGTPDYIAPEQIRNAQSADIRADVYSLGCTFYYLLTGRPPFRGDHLWDVYQAHFSMEAGPLNLVRPEVPVELAAVVAKMMAKDPGQRFQTPGEVARALAPFFKPGTSQLHGPGALGPGGETQVAPPQPSSAGRAATQPTTRGATPAPAGRSQAKTVAEGSPWESLLEVKENRPSLDAAKPIQPALHEAPDRWPPWFWPAIIAASVLGVLFLGLIVRDLSRPPKIEGKVSREIPTAIASQGDSAATQKSPAIDPQTAKSPSVIASEAVPAPKKKASSGGAPRVKKKPAGTLHADPELVAFYTFDDGKASDSTGRNHDGKFSVNPPTPESHGFQRGALRFHAQEDNSILIPVDINPTVMPQITMGGWFHPSGATREQALISHDDGGFDRTLAIDRRTRFKWSCFTGKNVFPGSAVTPERWTFVAMRHDQGTGKLMLDVDRDRFSKNDVYFGSGRPRTRIGRNPSFGAPFDGLIDNVFIYNSVLSNARIDEIRARGRAAILPVAE